MKILIASDSYKGSLGTLEAAENMKRGTLKVFPNAEVKILPIGDGGEGTVEVLISSLGGSYLTKEVEGPNGNPVSAKYGILENGRAVLEMAAASGLPLAGEHKDVMRASTYGTGELIKAALDQGCREIYIGIGGSATNDGGVGMAQALGISFKDSDGNEIGRGGGALSDICTIDVSNMDERIRKTKIQVMCDVKNPLCGEFGASAVYGPQKGATPELVKVLDENLKHLSEKVFEITGNDYSQLPGAGAAGGLGMGLVAFLGAELSPGIQAIMDATGFDGALEWCDLVLTGEGRIDHQSVCGKVIDGIASRAERYGKQVIAIAGSVSGSMEAVYKAGVASVEASVCRPMKVEEAIGNAAIMVQDAAERVMRTIAVGFEIAKACES